METARLPHRFSEQVIALLQAEILRACRRKRIPVGVREDFINDIWVWLMRMPDEPTVSRAWVRAVVETFWFRYQRRLIRLFYREVSLEGLPAFAPPLSPTAEPNLFTGDFLKNLNGTETRLAELLLQGMTWSEACRSLTIPEGSRSYWRSRLKARARSLVWSDQRG